MQLRTSSASVRVSSAVSNHTPTQQKERSRLPWLLFFVIFAISKIELMKEVTVVIPIYKESLSPLEQISFDSIIRELGERHPITIVKPESLDVTGITKHHKQILIECFEDSYFRNIASYNRLMLSEELYERFLDYRYILIAQTDVFIFRDELDMWCNKGYDYIGAPWLVRPIYRFPLFRLCSYLKRKYCEATSTPNSQVTSNRVGNGGLSLRRVQSHLDVVRTLHTVVESYLNYPRRTAIFNEDVFFAIEPHKAGIEFKYPSTIEALSFSIDKYPSLSMELLGGKLPMGCHGWYKRKMKGYWSHVILNGELRELMNIGCNHNR